MSFVDVIEAKDIEQLRQALLGLLDRLKEIVTELRDDTEVVVTIKFNKREKP